MLVSSNERELKMLTSYDAAQDVIEAQNDNVLFEAACRLKDQVRIWIKESLGQQKLMRKNLVHFYPAIDYIVGGRLVGLGEYLNDLGDDEWLAHFIDDLSDATYLEGMHTEEIGETEIWLRRIEESGA